jgi:hypothetical protein
MAAGWIALLLATATGAAVPVPSPATRTLSVSRQFAVYAADPLLAASLCTQAERLKHGLLGWLNLPDNWRDPIIVVLTEREDSETNATPVALQVLRTDTHLKYQLYARLPLDEESMSMAILEALCRELANRDLTVAHPPPINGAKVPLWLMIGLTELLVNPADTPLPLVRRSVVGGHPVALGTILAADKLPGDRAWQQLYRANAWLLVESLATLPGGVARLRRLVLEASPEV